ncbi:hypothetical protein [Streptosporangium sp. NPDC003464]
MTWPWSARTPSGETSSANATYQAGRGGANIELIDTIARHRLKRGHHVLIEGILYADSSLEATVQQILRESGPATAGDQAVSGPSR